jgi:uncharacterized membrane protein
MNTELSISLLVVVFAGALLALIPHITPRRYFFAITVPPEFTASNTARESLRRYHASVLVAVILSVTVAVMLAPRSPDAAMPVAVLLSIVVAFAAFLAERNRIARHATPLAAVREADLAPAQDQLPGWITLSLPPFALLPAVALYLRARWDEIPARFPIHWNAANQADGWADKSPHAVYAPLLIGGGMLLFVLLIGLGVFYGSRRGPQRLAVMKMLVAAMYVLAVMFTATALLPLVHFAPMLLLIPTGIFVVVVLVWSYRLVHDPNMPADATPDACWYLGSFYVNRQDPAIFVQKRIGFGYTFNMGNPLAWVLVGTMVAGMVLVALVRP